MLSAFWAKGREHVIGLFAGDSERWSDLDCFSWSLLALEAASDVANSLESPCNFACDSLEVRVWRHHRLVGGVDATDVCRLYGNAEG